MPNFLKWRRMFATIAFLLQKCLFFLPKVVGGTSFTSFTIGLCCSHWSLGVVGRFKPLAFPASIAPGDLVEVKRLLDAKSDPNSADAARGLGNAENCNQKGSDFRWFPIIFAWFHAKSCAFSDKNLRSERHLSLKQQPVAMLVWPKRDPLRLNNVRLAVQYLDF